MPLGVRVTIKSFPSAYTVEVASGSIERTGQWAARVVDSPTSVFLISNPTVYKLYGSIAERSLKKAGFRVNPYLIGDGERFKNFQTLEKTLAAMSESGISRSDAVVALGGGVVGDVAGFAASIHLRGIDLLFVPTTLLSMVDSSVGGKTGINTKFGKNLIGTFYQPKGVLIDPCVLETLPKREVTAGSCEFVKQSILAGPELFRAAANLLTGGPIAAGRLKNHDFQVEFESLIAAQVAFKADIVSGDEREAVNRGDARSRKVLNFGHTFAHALEKVTNYKYLKHGEAVGYGIIFAAQLSKKLGLLDEKVVNLLCDVVHRAGDLPKIGHIDPQLVFRALRHDKKNVNNSLQWVLLKDIGKPVIVPHREIGDSIVRSTIKKFIASN